MNEKTEDNILSSQFNSCSVKKFQIHNAVGLLP